MYRASRNGEVAAVKLMGYPSSAVWSTRFEREATFLKALTHPSIPKLYEFGRTDGLPFLVLELLDGISLDSLVENRGKRLSVEEVLAYASQALTALTVVHTRGIVHRDLKPSNLFLTEQGVLKVLDFGAAGWADRALASPHSVTSGLLGTPAYMPPEQARGRWDMVDCRSDIWSLGAVLFTLLSGEHVHPAQTSNEQLGLAMTCPARDLREVLPALDPRMLRAIGRALAYDREDRFNSAADFQAALCGSDSKDDQTAEDLNATVRELGSISGEAQAAPRGRRPFAISQRTAVRLGGASACLLALAALHHPGHRAVTLAEANGHPRAPSPTSPMSDKPTVTVERVQRETSILPISARSEAAESPQRAAAVKEPRPAQAKPPKPPLSVASTRTTASEANTISSDRDDAGKPAALDIRLLKPVGESNSLDGWPGRFAIPVSPNSNSPLDIRK